MKKKLSVKLVAILLLAATVLPSCATVFGGPVSACQRTKPAPGEPAREVRAGALIADILLFWPGAIVDFATGAIYKPCNK
ncbi:MAG TPA: hypothetical protein VKA27_18185 [Sunxiuqinia sp.]|nr:hypothetical protein [Sunxiuqinia sp.]